METSIRIRYVIPIAEECRNNCVLILKPGEGVPETPTDNPPSGMEWLYDSNGAYLYDENNEKVYITDIT